jgi:threonyl-tRNA synthetase
MGALPLWMSPEQVRILPISQKFSDFCFEVKKQLEIIGIRVGVDERNEKIGYKIREAQLEKVPYMLVIGEKEANQNQVAVRSRAKGDLGAMSMEAFIADIDNENKNRIIN